MSSIQVQTPPAAEPVSLAELKNHLRVTIANDDALIELYLQAARELVESQSGRSLVNKLYRQSHDRFPRLHDWGDFGTGYFYQAPRYARGHYYDDRQAIKLLRCPLVNVQKITYVDSDGVVQTLPPTPALWQASTEYELGDQAQDANGNLQQVTAVTNAEEDGTNESGVSVPSWASTLNLTTTDHDLTWTCIKIPAPAGGFVVDSDSEPPRIFPLYGAVWPATLRVPNAVQIFLTAGYGNDASSAPAALKVALMQLAGTWYQNRESVSDLTMKTIPYHLENLIWSERVIDYAPTR